MSTAVSSRAWTRSKTKGSLRLLLVAIAENADDDGYCWPGVDYLAEKVSQSSRQVQRNLPLLAETGEVYIRYRRGRGNSHEYLVVVGYSQEEMITCLVKCLKLHPEQAEAEAVALLERQAAHQEKVTSKAVKHDKMSPFINEEKVTFQHIKGDISTQKGDISDIKGDIAMSPEPCNLFKPSIEPSVAAGAETGGQEPGGKPAKAKTEKQLQNQEMFEALARLCQYDLGLITEDQRGALNQAGKLMREKGYLPADLDKFSTWWYANDWRGQKGQAPALKDVRENWGRFKTNQKGANGTNGHANSTGISGLQGRSIDNPIQKRANPRTGETYWVDVRTNTRVPAPDGA